VTDNKDPQEQESGRFDEDGSYVLEDTGESLDDFQEEEMKGLDDPRSEASDEGARVTSSGDVVELKDENDRLREQYIRKLADFENLRKRTEKEKQDFYRYSLSEIMKELLPVLDNFERALAAETERGEEFRKGVELIYKQLYEVLRKNGLTPIDDQGVAFDPQIHEAVMRDENSELPNHTVAELLQKGYFLHDRLLRPAMVKVAVGGPERTAADSGER